LGLESPVTDRADSAAGWTEPRKDPCDNIAHPDRWLSGPKQGLMCRILSMDCNCAVLLQHGKGADGRAYLHWLHLATEMCEIRRDEGHVESIFGVVGELDTMDTAALPDQRD
jgi:hypothetical protein